MKKLVLAGAFALFGAVTMNAQTTKGSWVIEGKTNLGFNSVSTKSKSGSSEENGPKVSTFNITPSVGYFVADNLAIGVDFGLISVTSKEEISIFKKEEKQTQLNILPNVTYYFATASNFRPYLGVGVGYGSVTSKLTETIGSLTNEDKGTYGGFLWGVKGGAVYLLNSTVGLNLGLGFNQFTSKENDVKTTASTFGVNAGISVFLK